MRLPNPDRAVVEERKLRDYLLSRSHPVGRFKAAFFADLGFSDENWTDLQNQLRELPLSQDAVPGAETEFGFKYSVSGTLKGPSGRSAEVVTIWIVLKGDDAPRLVTVYPM